MKEDLFLCNLLNPATNILNADSISVPEHNSSPNTKLPLSAIFIITRNSDISTAKVDSPLNILSFPRIREKIAV